MFLASLVDAFAHFYKNLSGKVWIIDRSRENDRTYQRCAHLDRISSGGPTRPPRKIGGKLVNPLNMTFLTSAYMFCWCKAEMSLGVQSVNVILIQQQPCGGNV